MTVIPALWKLMEDFKFKNHLTYKVKHCLKNQKQNKAFVELLFPILLANDLKLLFDYNCKVKSSIPILQFRSKAMCSMYKTG